MTTDRRKLYLTFGLASIGGYVWLVYNLCFNQTEAQAFGGCLIKHATDIPCPSCGVTRSVLLVLRGDLLESILMNPLGLIVTLIMVILPLWLLHDLIINKNGLFNAYQRTEKFLRRPGVFIPLILLLTVNWMWNIMKGL